MDNDPNRAPNNAPRAMSRQRTWANSPAGHLAARRAAEKSLSARRAAPRCGAARKSDGKPCQRPALKGRTRCRLHGGASGRGDQWHVVQWPGPDAPPEAIERKMRDLARREQRRLARVAAMTPEQREIYEKRRRAVQPRSVTIREQERRSRQAAALLGAAKPAKESVELAHHRAEYERLQGELACIDAEITASSGAEHDESER